MRKIVVLLLLFIIILTGCSSGMDGDNTMTNPTPSQTDFTNNESMYSLADFQAYLGPLSTPLENSWNGYVSDESVYTYESVNAHFTADLVGSYKSEQSDYIIKYTRYKIVEGGYFYIFWENKISSDFEIDEELSVHAMFYVTELKKSSDFDSIIVGQSTGADVTAIDSASEFVYHMGRGVASWHLLEDGSIMEIMYTVQEHFHNDRSRLNLLVESKEIVDPSRTGACLKYINPDDLP